MDSNGDVTMAGASSSDVPRSEWLVGDALDEALGADGEERIEVRWPFVEVAGKQDWEGREFVL